ncbi:MAG: transposase [Anaerolineales bacterium]|nr:MAG: transposase [Anaerolineales bacterium]
MKFKNKYRIESVRLRSWDYASPGWYFVTVCTKNKENIFGDVIAGEMYLSEVGRIVSEEWMKTAIIRSNILLDEWVVMPNHIHGILVITERMPSVETPRRGVSTSKWKPGTLGAIINQFKSISTKRIRRTGTTAFAWQPRFYDHIIRNEDALSQIRNYIHNNPQKWEDDKYFR